MESTESGGRWKWVGGIVKKSKRRMEMEIKMRVKCKNSRRKLDGSNTFSQKSFNVKINDLWAGRGGGFVSHHCSIRIRCSSCTDLYHCEPNKWGDFCKKVNWIWSDRSLNLLTGSQWGRCSWFLTASPLFMGFCPLRGACGHASKYALLSFNDICMANFVLLWDTTYNSVTTLAPKYFNDYWMDCHNICYRYPRSPQDEL